MNLSVRACALGLVSLSTVLSATAGPLSVEANKTVPVKLKGAAASVVLGNRNIADVAVHNDHLIFVTGKTFGTTNLMVFDRAGNQIYSSDVVVTVNASNLVTVNRSGSNFTYDCAPTCRSVLSTGDQSEYFDSLMKQQKDTQSLTEGE
ncbi:MAG TPA: pilus assembly protein N-terminal domain-containing protein [Hyphomonas sp.]|nr:pilus assembly protein N-terminal domain-containing protein [Hyphomonas sp.]MCB9970416.1 pilus assembly protein N-terminal domain-containing protein [Hyphomonas sp.]HPE47668.1 pilus assembly protein N-terminal domain-containing protein [Hyphomonas sp.]